MANIAEINVFFLEINQVQIAGPLAFVVAAFDDDRIVVAAQFNCKMSIFKRRKASSCWAALMSSLRLHSIWSSMKGGRSEGLVL